MPLVPLANREPRRARAPRAALPPPRHRAWLRIFAVQCSLPCDPPVGGHSCNGGMIPRFHRAVSDEGASQPARRQGFLAGPRCRTSIACGICAEARESVSQDKDLGFQRSPRPAVRSKRTRSICKDHSSGVSIGQIAVAVGRFELR